MRVLDLFSGIGGFSLGLERAGMRTIAFCEIDPYCRKVLAKHWPGIPCYDDVTTLTVERLAADGIIELVANADQQQSQLATRAGRAQRGAQNGQRQLLIGNAGVDVICGGFPCQDISTAGKGAGITGERSGLWKEYARIIGEVRPRYAIIENVSALLHRGIGDVLYDLSALGYDAEWHCIPASAVGAPHRRDRVWIIASDPRCLGRPATEPENPRTDRTPRSEWREQADGSAGYGDVADADQPRLEGWLRAGLRQCAGERAAWAGGASMADAPCELLNGSGTAGPRRRRQPSDGGGDVSDADSEPPGRPAVAWGERGHWLAEPDVGRVADGVPARVDRLRSLGNAVVPQIPEIIGRAIMATA